MRVSIIIPCYNEEQTLEKIIEKILNLKDLNKEIIVVDDFSTDKSTHILRNNLFKTFEGAIKFNILFCEVPY